MLRKKLKKSSVALLLGFALLGSSLTAYGATYVLGEEYEFEDQFIGVQDQRYDVDTQFKEQKDSEYATIAFITSNCSNACTAFRLKKKDANVTVSKNIIYIYHTDNGIYDIDYYSQWVGTNYNVTLVGQAASGYSGYTISGSWAPSGV